MEPKDCEAKLVRSKEDRRYPKLEEDIVPKAYLSKSLSNDRERSAAGGRRWAVSGGFETGTVIPCAFLQALAVRRRTTRHQKSSTATGE